MPGAMHSASGTPGFDRIEVFTGVERRRRWSRGEKLKTVEESRLPGMCLVCGGAQISIAPSLLFRWRKLMAEGGQEAVCNNDAIVSAAEVKELKKRSRELERVLGKKTLENEILAEAVKLAMKKMDLANALAAAGRFAMKVIADTMGVTRSSPAAATTRPMMPGFCP